MNKPPAEDPEFERWPPPLADPKAERIMPGWPVTILRGLCGRCPQCGAAPIFDGYLKVHQTCLHCAAPLGDMPADDAPPYVAMLVVLVGASLLGGCYVEPAFPGWHHERHNERW